MSKIRDLERQIAELRSENEQLQRKLRLLGAGKTRSLFSIPDAVTPIPKSISGLESMYVQVSRNDIVENCNTRFVELLGESKRDVIGMKVSDIDTIPWASSVLTTMLRESDALGDRIDFETSYIDPISGTERNMLIHAVWKDDRGTVTIDDTTGYHQILNTFRRYVSPAVIEKLQNSPGDYFKADRLKLSVLFADLRGFTNMSSGLSPEDVRSYVNEYVSAMIHIIDQYEGTVDKIIGDEVMAIFGAPIYYDDHAFRAIRVAIDMQRAHQELLRGWRSAGRAAPPVGIGINSGEMVVGNVGCEKRMDYTVIGHNVNIAARLCSAAEGGEILVSEQTCDELMHFAQAYPDRMRHKVSFRKTGMIRVKGIENEIPVARVLYEASGETGNG